jgi:hypothetical protein
MAATVGTQHADLPGPVLLSQDIPTRRDGICDLVSASRFSYQVRYRTVCVYGAGTYTVRYLPLSVFRIRLGLSADTVPDPAITLPRVRIKIRIQLYHNARGKPIIPLWTFTFLTKWNQPAHMSTRGGAMESSTRHCEDSPFQGGLHEGAKAQQIVKYAGSHFCTKKWKERERVKNNIQQIATHRLKRLQRVSHGRRMLELNPGPACCWLQLQSDALVTRLFSIKGFQLFWLKSVLWCLRQC